LARIHEPEKSGFPSAVRGVGASISTLPWASRGSPASGYFGHCAAIEAEQATMMATAPMNAESALFTLEISSDLLRFRRADPCIGEQQGRPGSYANTTAAAGRVYRLDDGGWLSGP
jgi:hypothetical protein